MHRPHLGIKDVDLVRREDDHTPCARYVHIGCLEAESSTRLPIITTDPYSEKFRVRCDCCQQWFGDKVARQMSRYAESIEFNSVDSLEVDCDSKVYHPYLGFVGKHVKECNCI